MRRISVVGLAALVALGPVSPALSAGRAVSAGSGGKTISVTAVPASLAAQPGALSFNSVGALGLKQGVLPHLAPASPSTVNNAVSVQTAQAQTAQAQAAPIAAQSRNSSHAAPLPAQTRAPVNRISLEKINALGDDGAAAPTLGQVIDSASRLAKAAPQHAVLFRVPSDRLAEFSGKIFDGSRALDANLADVQKTNPETPAPKVGLARRWIGSVGRLLKTPIYLPKFKGKPRVDTEYSKDAFGGHKALSPKALPENAGRWQRLKAAAGMHAGYGIKWGINLFAVATVLDTLVSPLITGLPWQLFLSEAALQSYGRVELLTAFGPAQIAQAMAASPFSFLLLALPAAVFMEELRHRMLSFGAWFIAAALARPAAAKASLVLDSIPNAGGLRAVIQWALKRVESISKHSYAIAAVFSSAGFAMAHIAMWGFHPYLILYHAVMGLALTHVAYRSRFFAAPFIAHFVFNAMTISLAVLAPALLGVQAASIASTILGLGSVAFLYYNWRSWRKGKKAAEREARGETEKKDSAPPRRMRWYSRVAGLFIIPVLLGAGFMGSGPSGSELMKAMNAGYVRMVENPVPLPNIQEAQPVETVPGHPAVGGDLGQLLNQLINGAAVATAPQLNTVEIVQRNKPAVVNVLTKGGTGTGFIINRDGTLITNAHVVAESVNQATGKISRQHRTEIMIRLTNGMKVPAQVMSYNPDKDMAVLKIIPQNPFGWPTVTIGDSGTLLEGQEIVAMGFPLGQPFTVTKGIISGLGNRGNGYIRFQQHDAAVNPGNSGGPLFNMAGEVVGINTQIVSPSGAFAGISRSITSQDLKNALAQYQAQGNISSPWMGAIFYPSDPASDGFGAAVEAVRDGSPAAAAGLQAGDIIVGVEGRGLPPHPLGAFSALSSVMRSKAPTDSLTLQVDRDGTVLDITITLGAH